MKIRPIIKDLDACVVTGDYDQGFGGWGRSIKGELVDLLELGLDFLGFIGVGEGEHRVDGIEFVPAGEGAHEEEVHD